MNVFDVAGNGGRWAAKKCLNHFAAYEVGVPVLAGKFWDHCPDILIGGRERFAESLNSRAAYRRTIN